MRNRQSLKKGFKCKPCKNIGMTCKFSYQQRKYLRRIRLHWVYIVLAEVWVKTFVQTKNVLQSHSLTWSLSIWSAIIHTLWSRRLVVDNKKEKLLKHSLIKKLVSVSSSKFVNLGSNGHSACINFRKQMTYSFFRVTNSLISNYQSISKTSYYNCQDS